MQHEDKDQCEVCCDFSAITKPSRFDGTHQVCDRCGEFKITGTANSVMRSGLGKEKRAFLSGWVRNENRLGIVPEITSENLEKVLATPIPSFIERASALLEEASLGLKGLGDSFYIKEPRFLAATYSSTFQDVIYLLEILRKQGLAEAKELGGRCEILPDGYVKLEELRGKRLKTENNFTTRAKDFKTPEINLSKLILNGESEKVEFKSTLRTNLQTKTKDTRMEFAVLKTLAGLLNTNGGILIIGVSDDGKPVGIQEDGFVNEDKMNLHLVNIVKSNLGITVMTRLKTHFEDYDEFRVMVIACEKSPEPVFLKDGNSEKFYIRTGPSTSELKPIETYNYIKHRFKD